MEEPANIMEETRVTLSFSITHALFFLPVEIKFMLCFYAFSPLFLSALQFDVGLCPVLGFLGWVFGQFCVWYHGVTQSWTTVKTPYFAT